MKNQKKMRKLVLIKQELELKILKNFIDKHKKIMMKIMKKKKKRKKIMVEVMMIMKEKMEMKILMKIVENKFKFIFIS